MRVYQTLCRNTIEYLELIEVCRGKFFFTNADSLKSYHANAGADTNTLYLYIY